MHIREPQIRHRADGKYLVRWGGKDHYLATDAATAQKLWESPSSTHPGARHHWARWASARKRGTDPARHLSNPLLIDVMEDMLRDYSDRGRDAPARYFRKHLARFMDLHGAQDIVALSSPEPSKKRFAPPIIALLNAYIADMASIKKTSPAYLKPKTINHDAGAVKRLFAWAASRSLCPEVRFTGVKRLGTRRGDPQVLTPRQVVATIKRAGKVMPDLVPWLALNYLGLCRPSEVITLAHQNGRFEPIRQLSGKIVAKYGLFALAEHKTLWRGEQYERFVVLTPEALTWLKLARPRWKSLDSYSKACVSAGVQGGPSVMRDSAASHLRALGVPLADVEIALGHMPPGEWKSYAQVPWLDVRAKVARIGLQSAGVHPAEWDRLIQASDFARSAAKSSSQVGKKHAYPKVRKPRVLKKDQQPHPPQHDDAE